MLVLVIFGCEICCGIFLIVFGLVLGGWSFGLFLGWFCLICKVVGMSFVNFVCVFFNCGFVLMVVVVFLLIVVFVKFMKRWN